MPAEPRREAGAGTPHHTHRHATPVPQQTSRLAAQQEIWILQRNTCGSGLTMRRGRGWGAGSSMTHLHIPDGVLPFWLWASGLALSAALIFIGARVASGPDFRRRLPILSMTSAFMIIAMSVPIIPAIYHVQLAGLAGIILGPALGLIAVFIVNLLLALVGHGGITVVGLNTLILGSEMLATWALFRLLGKALTPGPAAGIAAFLAMVVGAGVMLGVIALASPQVGLTHVREVTSVGEHEHHAEVGSLHAAVPYANLSLARFAFLVIGLGSIGWALEGLVTGLVVRFAVRVKPDLVGLEPVRERT